MAAGTRPTKAGDGMKTLPIALNARAWLKLQFRLRTWQAMAEYHRRRNTAASTPKPVMHDMMMAQEDVDRYGIRYAVSWTGEDEGVFG